MQKYMHTASNAAMMFLGHDAHELAFISRICVRSLRIECVRTAIRWLCVSLVVGKELKEVDDECLCVIIGVAWLGTKDISKVMSRPTQKLSRRMSHGIACFFVTSLSVHYALFR